MQNKQRTIFYVTAASLLCVVSFWLGTYYGGRNVKSGEAASPDSNSVAEDNSEAEAVVPTLPAKEASTEEAIPTVTEEAGTPTQEATADEKAITYSNTQYGFDFQLPASWDGYTIQTEEWQGTAITGERQGEVVETGDIVIIRHPDWTEDNPRQDIPIMVYTLKQWKKVDEDMAVSAAPIPPMELGRNSSYVFALPARYNYAFPAGFEEVEDILASNALVANEIFSK